MHAKNFELILTKTFLLNARTRHLEFQLANNISLEFIPGQFISIHFKKDEQIIRRNFSIASSPNKSGELEIAATFVPNGVASTSLWNMQVGDRLSASGPFGIFIIRPEHVRKINRYILVATGTGVTPYRSMLSEIKILLEQNPGLKIELLLGVRNRSELLYGEEFLAFATAHQYRFNFTACYSREQFPYQEYEYNGYVQNKLQELNIDPLQDVAYLCGNPNMVDQAFDILSELNLPRNKIIREKYISSK